MFTPIQSSTRRELWNYEKEKESILTKIEKEKSLYEKIKAVVITHK
jgi:hypothetical protein